MDELAFTMEMLEQDMTVLETGLSEPTLRRAANYAGYLGAKHYARAQKLLDDSRKIRDKGDNDKADRLLSASEKAHAAGTKRTRQAGKFMYQGVFSK